MNSTGLEQPLPTAAAGRRWTAISLRTLFLVMILIALATALLVQGWKLRELHRVIAAHDINPASISVNQFSVAVKKLTNSRELALYEISIQTLGSTRLLTGSNDRNSEITIEGAPETPTQAQVIIMVDLLNRVHDQPPMCRYLVQVGQRGVGSVGGPGTSPVPQGATLNRFFSLLLKPGVYGRGQKVALCTIGDKTTYLTVK